MEDALELVVVAAPGTLPFRLPLTRLFTTIGSDSRADVRIAGLAVEWGIVKRSGAIVELTHLPSGAVHVLALARPIELDGVRIELAQPARTAPLSIEPIAAALADVQSPAQALDRLLRELLRATGSDRGAIVLSDRGSHRIAAALDAQGRPLERAAELLSDTIVRDALDGGRELRVEDAANHPRYRNVTSVIALGLASIACVPMPIGRHLYGLVFLGRKDLRRPFGERELDELRVLAAMAVPFLVRLEQLPSPSAPDALIGDSPPMRELRRVIERVARSDLSVLVLGETGTGKELVARAIHAASPRSAKTLIAVNTSAIPESLMAAELFGVKKGAFTGAAADRRGLIEQAHEGTLFLDEIGDMPRGMQAALLRVTELREVVRVGDTASRSADVRIVAATHKDLDAAVATGEFREDLLFRLREVTLRVPPLRERAEDIVLLALYFLRRIEAELALEPRTLEPSARDRLLAHRWPGNVRELRAVVRRSAILCDGPVLRAADILLDAKQARPASPLGNLDRTLQEARDEFVAAYVHAVVERHEGSREAAAAALGISIRSLYRFLNQSSSRSG